MNGDAKSKYKGRLARVEVYRAKTGEWNEVGLNWWHTLKLWIRRKLNGRCIH